MATPSMRSPTDRDVAAARENAEWVDLFCRSHGVMGQFAERAWHSPIRTPPMYPDAVTFSRTATEVDVLSGIDIAAGASVKDSFSALDLSPWGFRRLFEAHWIWRDAQVPLPDDSPPARAIAWRVVGGPAELAAWERGWADDASAVGHFPPDLLGTDRLRILAGYEDGALVAGVLLHLTDEVVGVSNAFHRGLAPTGFWRSCVRPALDVAAERPLVGYETGDDLTAAGGAGFEALGPLTVWCSTDRGSSGPG